MGFQMDEDNRRKIKELHNIATKMESARSEEEIYDMTIEAARNILEFYVCSIFIQVESDRLEVKKSVGGKLKKGDILPLRDSVYTKTLMEKRSYLVDNIDEFKGAKPSLPEFKSAISIPIGNIGVFQAISDKLDNFDEDDLEMGELLVSHLTETLKRIRNEKTVRESEKRYRAIFNNTGTGKVILDSDMKINTVNKEFETLSGYKKKELEGHVNIKDFLYDEDIKQIEEFMEEVKGDKSNYSKNIELNFIDKHGNPKDTIGAISNIPDLDEFNLSLFDITDFKWAVEELQRSEKKYQTIFEKSETAMLIIRKDTVVEMVNPKFVEIFGYSRKEVENNMSWTELVVEDYLPMMEEYHQKRRIDPDSAPSNYECEVIDKKGNIRKVLLNVGMIPETEKSLVSVIDISQKDDISELESLFEGSDSGMFVLNSDKDMIKVNSTFLDLFDLKKEDVIGKSYKETVLSTCKNSIEKVISGGDRFISEIIEFSLPEGEIMKAELNLSRINEKGIDEQFILGQIYHLN